MITVRDLTWLLHCLFVPHKIIPRLDRLLRWRSSVGTVLAPGISRWWWLKVVCWIAVITIEVKLNLLTTLACPLRICMEPRWVKYRGDPLRKILSNDPSKKFRKVKKLEEWGIVMRSEVDWTLQRFNGPDFEGIERCWVKRKSRFCSSGMKLVALRNGGPFLGWRRVQRLESGSSSWFVRFPPQSAS